jgi:NAD(P)H-dependent FMN reductase
MTTKAKVLLIMGSTRAGRICPVLTEWVADIGRLITSADYEVIDLANWKLPMDDEPGLPALGIYTQEHTRAWSKKISSCDGIIFVTPQFNWGYPAVLKNAIDHLYTEWRSKPAMIVTYGGHGGGKCADQLRQVMGSVKMQTVETSPAITLSEAIIREGAVFDPERDAIDQLASIKKALKELSMAISRIDGLP